jgi:hypothetical protein
VIILVTLGAFMVGTWLNRQRGKSFGKWIDEGLQSQGGRPLWTVVRSISSGAQATLRNPNAPFSSLEVGYFLLTREIPPLFGLELLRGKRDLLSIKADLRKSPAIEFDVVPMNGPLARELDRSAGDQPYTWVELSDGMGLATKAVNPQQVAARVRPFVERYGKSLQRLSVRQRQPNVILFMHLTGVQDRPAKELFEALRRVV